MKLATTTEDFFGECDTHIERVKNVYATGFRCIDLSLYGICEEDELLLNDNWRKNAEEIKKYADIKGLEFVQAHGPGVNPLESEAEFDNSLKLTLRAMEICSYFGITNMVVHAGWRPDITDKEEWFVKNKSFYEKLFPEMERLNVNILHENTYKTDEAHYYNRTGKDMREFSEFVNHPMFHSCWDTGHGNIGGGSQYDDIIAMGDDLYAVHINDNHGQSDDHIIPFMGTVNMDEIINALMEIDFKGPFTFECSRALRPEKCWFGNRVEFKKDKRLASPGLELKREIGRFMYKTGKYILRSYDLM